jgi:hypothetical protein
LNNKLKKPKNKWISLSYISLLFFGVHQLLTMQQPDAVLLETIGSIKIADQDGHRIGITHDGRTISPRVCVERYGRFVTVGYFDARPIEKIIIEQELGKDHLSSIGLITDIKYQEAKPYEPDDWLNYLQQSGKLIFNQTRWKGLVERSIPSLLHLSIEALCSQADNVVELLKQQQSNKDVQKILLDYFIFNFKAEKHIDRLMIHDVDNVRQYIALRFAPIDELPRYQMWDALNGHFHHSLKIIRESEREKEESNESSDSESSDSDSESGASSVHTDISDVFLKSSRIRKK